MHVYTLCKPDVSRTTLRRSSNILDLEIMNAPPCRHSAKFVSSPLPFPSILSHMPGSLTIVHQQHCDDTQAHVTPSELIDAVYDIYPSPMSLIVLCTSKTLAPGDECVDCAGYAEFPESG